ncbi:MAG: arginine--tRNA ligase [Planctomycetes bacterium]|nr:arginine--tRNA ligase [Planctomycetota bacterium]
MKPVIEILNTRIADAMTAATGESDCLAIVKQSGDVKFGHYQANGCMALAKRVKTNPRELAAKVVENLKIDDICETPEIAGPGFINLTLKNDFLSDRLMEIAADDKERLAIDKTSTPKKVVVDFSSPNIAKQMHVGHLRSTIIGDTIARILNFLGHDVIKQNHIGDWGTQFGRVILGLWHLCMAQKHGNTYYRTELKELKDCKEDDGKLKELCLAIRDRHEKDWEEDRLDKRGDGEVLFHPYIKKLKGLDKGELWSQFLEVYQYVNLVEESITGMNLEVPSRKMIDGEYVYSNMPYESVSRLATVMLQNEDDQENKAWEYISELTLNYCQKIYDRLSVLLTEDDVCGESFYKDRLPGIVEELKDKDLATESEGAMCVFPEGFTNKEGNPLPFIIQKSDGAFLYATTDLAAINYRIKELDAEKIIYVTDARQQLHFQMLFATAKAAGWLTDDVEVSHVTFGTMMGEDGKPLKTRSGENVNLSDLLDEAVERASKVVEAKNPDLGDAEKASIANAVGIGAVKYADFSNNRTTDFIFSFDKSLAMEGNTAPYMQYAYARVKSIERKAVDKGIDVAAELTSLDTLNITEPAEMDLALHIIRYSEAINVAAGDCRPNYLTAYLYDLAQKFSTFYNACPVLIATEDKRPTRLMLCDLTAKTIAHGLTNLLGIEVVEKM